MRVDYKYLDKIEKVKDMSLSVERQQLVPVQKYNMSRYYTMNRIHCFSRKIN